MRRSSIAALAVAVAGLTAILWGFAGGPSPPPAALLVGAGFAPAAVLLAVWSRLGGRFPMAAVLTGALLAPLLTLLGHAVVVAFTATFVQGFADSGRSLLESLRADPRLTTALASPWVIVLLVDLAAVAPLTEEAAKGVSARIARPRSRRDALLFGVAAGAGFSLTENVLYASLGWVYGGPWPTIALSRSLGAAVHPLACALVMLGWWEWREQGRPLAALRGYLAGAGVHALWNGSVVVVGVVAAVISAKGSLSLSLRPVALTYAAVLGAVLAGVLALVTLEGDAAAPGLRLARLRDHRTLAAWTVMSASLLIPLGVLVLAFPSFYRG